MSKIKHLNETSKHYENAHQPSKSPLFSKTDAKSVEISGYSVGHGAPQTDDLMEEYSIPTGVVDIDESVVLPTNSSFSNSQHHPTLSEKTLFQQKHNTERIYLPPIYRQYHTDRYYYIQPSHHHSHLNHHKYRSSHHHHHHHHHKHGETYDPRWWYMPINSVHAPKSQRIMSYHYKPPKWYEMPRRD